MWSIFSTGNLYRVVTKSGNMGEYLEMVYWSYIITHDKVTMYMYFHTLWTLEFSLCSQCSEISWWWALHGLSFFIHVGYSHSSFNFKDSSNSFLGNSFVFITLLISSLLFSSPCLFLELLLFICWDSWMYLLSFLYFNPFLLFSSTFWEVYIFNYSTLEYPWSKGEYIKGLALELSVFHPRERTVDCWEWDHVPFKN